MSEHTSRLTGATIQYYVLHRPVFFFFFFWFFFVLEVQKRLSLVY